MAKTRLDTLVFQKGLFDSREKAKAVIMSGAVFVDGNRAIKPGAMVEPDAIIQVRVETLQYVSRGGLKLEKAMDEFGISPGGKICIDCGASTGGFTDCLLQRGAAKVYSIDVGYGQFDWKLRNDPRVVVMERTNVRHLKQGDIPDWPEIAVVDVSFISLKLILPAVRELLAPSGEAICLIKPQFEAGRSQVGKKGVVRDPEVHAQVLSAFISYATAAGFSVCSLTFSPVKGPEGNIEFLGHLVPPDRQCGAPDVEEIVSAAHNI